jgi:hypothetical protein
MGVWGMEQCRLTTSRRVYILHIRHDEPDGTGQGSQIYSTTTSFGDCVEGSLIHVRERTCVDKESTFETVLTTSTTDIRSISVFVSSAFHKGAAPHVAV